MIKAANKSIACLVSRDAGITKEYSSSHNGTDWGWVNNAYSNIYPMQDGIVRECGYEGYNSGIGYYVTIEHQYDDGTRSFSGYIHLLEVDKNIKVGTVVEAGKTVLGKRGGTPYDSKKKMRYAPHLHLYTTPPTTKGYSWNTMKSLAANPFKHYTFCKLKGVTYSMASKDGHNFNNAPIYEETLHNETEEIQQLKEQVARLSEDLAIARNKVDRIKAICEE